MSSKLSIPNVVRRSIENMIDGKVTKAEPLSGGCSFPTYTIQCKGENFFLKFSDCNTDVFIKEAHGLDELSSHQKITPEVYIANNNCLLLEYIAPNRPTLSFWQNLATSMATLHKTKKNGYGFHEDNFIGSSTQHNTVSDKDLSWFDFFWNYRIQPQIHWIEKSQNYKIDAETFKQLKFKVKQELNNYETSPTIVHGDLWSGNIHCGNDQNAYLLDPAVYFGDREVDLAMTRLFGGFSESFYETYDDLLPLERGYEKRQIIYNLYHLLNHYHLFGPPYKSGVENAMAQIIAF